LLQKKKIAPEKMTKRASYASEEDYIATEKMTKASNHQTERIEERSVLSLGFLAGSIFCLRFFLTNLPGELPIILKRNNSQIKHHNNQQHITSC